MQNIGINETFTAGDFPVTIKQVSGSNGRFRGVGYIVVPYLADTKLAVSFTNIRINTDYQLIEGVVSTTYDTTWGDVESADEFIDGLGDLIDEIEETVNTLFENGEITSEEKEDALGQLNEATTNLQGAAEQQNQADEKKQQAEKAESPEKEKLQEEAEKLEKESKETQQEVNKALNELQNKFGVKGKDGGLEIKTDAFFDGVISYGKGKNVITHKRLDGNGEISINRTDSNNNIPDTSDYNFTHNGKQYNVIVTHSNSTIEAINEAKDKAVNPSTGIVIYFHYDLEKENLGYTVNFAPDYFDNLPNQDFLEVQELHKEALSNLLKQLQSSEDIINVIYNNVLEINTLFQESLNKIQLPETIWNPDAENYTNNDFHFEPLEAGLIDGAIEEIKSIPLLISLVVDYSTNPKTREKINKAFSDFDFTNAMDKWYESRKDLYTSGTIHKIEHRTGKDVVEVGTLIGTGGLTTLGKIKKGADLVEGVTSAIKKVAKEGRNVLAGVKSKLKFTDSQWAKFESIFKNNAEFLNKINSNPSYVKSIQRIEEGGVDLISHQNYVRYVEKMARYQDEIARGGEGVVKYYRVQTSHPLSKYMSVESGSLKFHKKTDLNISTTNKLHAEEYAAKKLAKEPKGGFVEIIEFEVPKSVDLEMKKVAIPQDSYKKNLLNLELTAPKIVDPTTRGNPFELPLGWRNRIEMNYIDGSAKIISKTVKN
ncbi:hypothetical protein JIP1097_20001 [Tenacibaculum maritimum]|nr:hypothetical protein JIP1097_20001 [Tenacibaculum maritimum]